MRESSIRINDYEIRVHHLNTVVVGTGAAGFNAADRLFSFGQRDIALVTDNLKGGTSRNTGSDKQTYYKLTLSGDEQDSVGEMAKTLFEGQCVDGDIALAEAALSVSCFCRLAELGVPFPQNRFGEYIGYRTDHDPKKRASSAGPYTSKMMTECLEKAVLEKNIRIFDRLQVIRILTHEGQFYGLLCLNLSAGSKEDRYVAFNCKNAIYAVGGPAGMYQDSVYPTGHWGASGIAFEAGVKGKNLTEWQYGLASVKPRWNVSGSYMQALPRFISTDAHGMDEREFLSDFFRDRGELLSKIFLKGYQWPFDARKINDGSSVIDLLVYAETCLKGRRVFLDFRGNPGHEEIDFSSLTSEAGEYLKKAGADFGTPIERLSRMNAPAVEFYRSRRTDLRVQPLEIALCAQHNNGGLSADAWWQTNVEGFFAAGEVCGSHGVYRPGGSALNAGQAGSLRAARYIASNRQGEPASPEQFGLMAFKQIAEAISLGEACLCGESGVKQIWDNARARMSLFGGPIRSQEGITQALSQTEKEIKRFKSLVKIDSVQELYRVYRLYDMLISQYVYLSAMLDYLSNGGGSRGSALYSGSDGTRADEGFPGSFSYMPDSGLLGDSVQEVSYRDGVCSFQWRKVRELPREDDFFENVWREFRINENVY